MNSKKIYAREQDIQPIGLQLTNIIQEAISACSKNPTQSLIMKTSQFALSTYFNLLQEHLCDGFIDYYDFEPKLSNLYFSPFEVTYDRSNLPESYFYNDSHLQNYMQIEKTDVKLEQNFKM